MHLLLIFLFKWDRNERLLEFRKKIILNEICFISTMITIVVCVLNINLGKYLNWKTIQKNIPFCQGHLAQMDKRSLRKILFQQARDRLTHAPEFFQMRFNSQLMSDCESQNMWNFDHKTYWARAVVESKTSVGKGT